MDFSKEFLFEEEDEQEPVVPQPQIAQPAPVINEPEVATGSPLDFSQDFYRPDLEEAEAPKFSDEEIVGDKDKMEKIRRMMIVSKGSDYRKKSDEEVYRDFMAHMRWVNANEVSTAAEVASVFGADEDTKRIYGEAYQVYEQKGNALTSGTWGDLGSAVYDYGSATLFSPSLYAGAVVGKVVGRGASAAARQKIIDELGYQALKKGASKQSVDAARREVINMSARITGRQATKAVLAAGAVEMGAAAAQDTLYQNLLIDTGVQDEFSLLQTGVSVLTAGAFGLTPLIGSARKRGASGLGSIRENLADSKQVRRSKLKGAAVKDLLPAFKKKAQEWAKLADNGTNFGADPNLREQAIRWFADPNDPQSLVNFLQKNGVDLDVGTSGGFSRSLVDFVGGLDDDVRRSMDEALQPVGISLTQLTEIFAATAREAGQNSNILSQGSKFFENYKNVAMANGVSAENIMAEASKGALSNSKKLEEKDTLRYIQSSWKRAIVSSLPTTVVNIKGWAAAESFKSVGEAFQVALSLGDAGVRALMGKDASVPMVRAKALFANLTYSTRLAVDPFTTVDGFYKLLEQAPSKYRNQVNQQFFSGVNNRGAASFGMDDTKGLTKWSENYLTVAQRISFVNAQDVMTKALSGMKELDKQVRLEHNTGIVDLLNAGRAHEISTKAWDRAVSALQETTFSKDYSKQGGYMGQLAGMVQKASDLPGVGFLFPFGQFVNSVVAFSYKYTPAAFVGIAAKLAKSRGKDLGTFELQEQIARATVGTGFLGYMWKHEAQKREEGLQWNEERDQNGEVYKVDNTFPISLYNITGRLLDSIGNGEEPDKDLMKELGRQLALPAAMEEVFGDNLAVTMAEFVYNAYNGGEGDGGVIGMAGEMVGIVGAGAANIASGFTRPLDTANDIIGAVGSANGTFDISTPDRKQLKGGEKVLGELSRYTDNFFKLAFGEDVNGKGLALHKPKHSATQDGPVGPGNAFSALFGHNVQQRRTSIDKILGMVNKTPFRADSFTTGVPEYDDWFNQRVYPELERVAIGLLQNKSFMEAPLSVQRDVVDQKLAEARANVKAELERPVSRFSEGATLKLRADMMALPASQRNRALENLGLPKDLSKLNLYQLNMLKEAISLEKQKIKKF